MKEWKIRLPEKKILILAGIFLFMIIVGCVRNFREGIYILDDFLVQKSEDYFKSGKDEIRLVRASDGTTFELTFNGVTKRATLVWSKSTEFLNVEHDYASVTFDEGVVAEGIWFSDSMLMGLDRMPLSFTMDEKIRFSNGKKSSSFEAAKLAEVLCRLDLGDTEKNGDFRLVLMGGLLYVIGALVFLYPDKMHFMGSRWQYKHAELSDDGRLAEQAGGVVMMIVGFVAAINVYGLF
ncbi:MAG: hypothetical protein IJO55_03240 [Lachnospiraceae bacterium]|nr:hypothetical protein [Lachnospiraceae bacterium]